MTTEQTPKKCKVRELKDANANRIMYRYYAPAEYRVDDILDPSFWSVHSRYFNVHDLIEVIWQDNTKECMLRVLDCNETMAKVALRGDVVLYDDNKDLEVLENKIFELKWLGPQRKFAIRRQDNNEVLEEGIATKEQGRERIKVLTQKYGS